MRGFLAALFSLSILALAGPAAAATTGTVEFLYDDDGDPTDGIDSGGGDGVDTSGVWSTMEINLIDGAGTDGLELKITGLDPTGAGETQVVDYDVTGVAFVFKAGIDLTKIDSVILNDSSGGNLALDWEIGFVNDGSPGGDMLPEPTNGIGDPGGVLTVDLSVLADPDPSADKGVSVGQMDQITIQFNDDELSGMMLEDIIDFSYLRYQSVTVDGDEGPINTGSLFLGGELPPIPLPPAIALLGSGVLFLFGFVGLRRRSSVA